MTLAQWLAPGDYADFLWLVARMAEVPNCPPGVDARELPPDCRESADTPAELFEKLHQWGYDALVIPHGLAWGIHSPRGARLDNQLTPEQHDPELQRLIEVWSGHGNSEQFRPRPELGEGETCSAPTADFLPCCWQAGEIMRARCGDLLAAECEARVAEARDLALQARVAPQLVFPDTTIADWLDCDQCRDCFKPAFAQRMGETAQYGLALSDFSDLEAPLRFQFGFIASTDNHTARPGTGYKQYDRKEMTDARGPGSSLGARVLAPIVRDSMDDSRRPQPVDRQVRSFPSLLDTERFASFMYPGGLVAVHAPGRDRRSIWDALVRREVYGTSGPRILLWFDLVNGPDGRGRVPMGAEVALAEPPQFVVRAAGALEQQPGCPDDSLRSLSPERLDHLCRGECYHPGETRHPLAAIEVVRVRPQQTPGEDVAPLIEDPWRTIPCPPDPAGCVVGFSDPEFSRDSVYYVRALQVPTPAINGANLRAERDAAGRTVATRPCSGDYRSSDDDDCLAPVQERAWSSPIYVRRALR
jgi:hypothetical protein